MSSWLLELAGVGGLGIEALPDDVLRPDPVTGALLIGLSIPYINPIILNPKPQTDILRQNIHLLLPSYKQDMVH